MSDIYEENGNQYSLCEFCGKPVELESDDCIEVGGVRHVRQIENIIDTFFMHETCFGKCQERIDENLEDIRLLVQDLGSDEEG
jgi:hypothetical protein